jgi:hypothetical protein
MFHIVYFTSGISMDVELKKKIKLASISQGVQILHPNI